MIKFIPIIAILIASTSVFAVGADQKDGQGCILRTDGTKGSCGMQLISPLNKSMTCKLTAEGTTRSGRKIRNHKITVLQPRQVDQVEVHSTVSDPIIDIVGGAKCE